MPNKDYMDAFNEISEVNIKNAKREHRRKLVFKFLKWLLATIITAIVGAVALVLITSLLQ